MKDELEDDSRFAKLLSGAVPSLKLLIARGSTLALPDSFPSVGVYTMTREDFLTIASAIMKSTPRHKFVSSIVLALDDPYGDGIGGRWFRLSDPVHAWLLRCRPEAIEVDGMIF